MISSSVVAAYSELEQASLALRTALVASDGVAVSEATRRLSLARDSVMSIIEGLDGLSAEQRGFIRAVAMRVSHINDTNVLLSKRRLTHIRQLRQGLSRFVKKTGYTSEGGTVLNVSKREAVDEMA